jgi:hypothetical protein
LGVEVFFGAAEGGGGGGCGMQIVGVVFAVILNLTWKISFNRIRNLNRLKTARIEFCSQNTLYGIIIN